MVSTKPTHWIYSYQKRRVVTVRCNPTSKQAFQTVMTSVSLWRIGFSHGCHPVTVIGVTNDHFERVTVKEPRVSLQPAGIECKVKRLIYTSTADVVIDNIDEDHPSPKRSLCKHKGKCRIGNSCSSSKYQRWDSTFWNFKFHTYTSACTQSELGWNPTPW